MPVPQHTCTLSSAKRVDSSSITRTRASECHRCHPSDHRAVVISVVDHPSFKAHERQHDVHGDQWKMVSRHGLPGRIDKRP